MNDSFRTDLAAELINDKTKLPRGVEYESRKTLDGFVVEKIFVDSDGENEFGKPVGTYVTVNCGSLADLDHDAQTQLSLLLAEEIKQLTFEITKKSPDINFNVLVVGLGNINMTPDAIGPKCVSFITVTRKLAEEIPTLFKKIGCASVSAVTPGTSGQTGIETYELVRCASKCVSPNIIIAIDALAARSSERLGTTVQISSSGIHPGSGVGNRRKGLNFENLGVPVIAVGVPTVVDSSTIIKDVILKFGVENIPADLERLIDGHESFLVSPGNCDSVIAHASKILASAIDTAFGINQ